MNGTFLVVSGLARGRLSLGATALKVLFAVVVYGASANWLATQLEGKQRQPDAAAVVQG